MLKPVSHHFSPTDPDDLALCGRPRRNGEPGSAEPTCLVCALRLDAEDAMDAQVDEPLPLEAPAPDPMLNAGIPAPVADAARVVYARYFPPEARLFAGRRR